MIDKLNQKYEPSDVLVVYKNKDNDSNYIEIHGIKKGQLTEGRPLKKKTLQDLLINCSDKAEVLLPFSGRIPAEILYYNCNPNQPKLIWFEPMQNRRLLFEGELKGAHETCIPSAIFCYNYGHLYVYAVNKLTKEQLSDDDILFNYPLPNIYDSGSVCMGNVDINTEGYKYIEEVMKACSQKFWESKFTSFHADAPLKGQHAITFWKQRFKQKDIFPLGVLNPTKKKLKELWNGKADTSLGI